MQDKKTSLGDAIVVGFAMFAIFFGAGNLIFPPFLGRMAGDQWFSGFLCFIIADAGLAMMTVLAMIRGDGTIDWLFSRLGKGPAKLLAALAMICVGPMICIPRTCATTFEMGVLPLMPNFSSWLFAGIFFGIVLILTIRPSAVVDIIGKFLTPILLLTLAVLFVIGIMNPIGEISPDATANVLKEGFLAGYQTMDVLGALAITMVIVGTVDDKGYLTKKSQTKLISSAALVATLGLFTVYGGLTYLGATTSMLDLGDINQTALVVEITNILMKKLGVVLLAAIVFFACLTTAIGLVSSGAEYFGNLTKNKFKYETWVIMLSLAGFFISNAGITTIINIATPILNLIYPILVGQIVLSFFNEKIKNDNIYKGTAIATLLVCALGVAADFGAPFGFIHSLPLAAIGFYWILPAVVGGILGAVVPAKQKV